MFWESVYRIHWEHACSCRSSLLMPNWKSLVCAAPFYWPYWERADRQSRVYIYLGKEARGSKKRNIIQRLKEHAQRRREGVKCKKVAKGNISLHYVFFATQCRLKMTHILLHPDTSSSCRKSLSLPQCNAWAQGKNTPYAVSERLCWVFLAAAAGKLFMLQWWLLWHAVRMSCVSARNPAATQILTAYLQETKINARQQIYATRVNPILCVSRERGRIGSCFWEGVCMMIRLLFCWKFHWNLY